MNYCKRNCIEFMWNFNISYKIKLKLKKLGALRKDSGKETSVFNRLR